MHAVVVLFEPLYGKPIASTKARGIGETGPNRMSVLIPTFPCSTTHANCFFRIRCVNFLFNLLDPPFSSFANCKRVQAFSYTQELCTWLSQKLCANIVFKLLLAMQCFWKQADHATVHELPVKIPESLVSFTFVKQSMTFTASTIRCTLISKI